MRQFMKFRGCLLATLFFAACNASNQGGAANEDGPSGDDVGNPGTGGDGIDVPAPTPLKDFKPAPGRLALLTSEQYRSSLSDLLGIDAAGIEVPGDVPLYGFTTIGASSISVSAKTGDTLDRSVRTEVGKVLADVSKREALTGCSANVEKPQCVDEYIGSFGRRAFRRPLDAQEFKRLRGLFDTVVTKTSDRWMGLQMVTTAILASPKFLYFSEQGEGSTDGTGNKNLSAFEFAARLSFWLSGSTPDNELLDAAENGDLQNSEGIARQTNRLLSSPRAAAALERFFGELYSLPIDHIEKDPTLFPFVAKHPELAASMRSETSTMATTLALDVNGDIGELLDANYSFVDPLLAEFYGVKDRRDPSGKVQWPPGSPRSGLMTHAGILAVLSKETSTIPTRRGRFVRERILCQHIPDPPPNVAMQLPEATGGEVKTQRQRLDVHNIKSECKSCHELLDPVGLVLERFDAAGLYRDKENGVSIDTSGELDGFRVADARELGKALRSHPDALPCVFRQAYRYATGHLETAGEEPLVQQLGEYLAKDAQGSFRKAITALAQHPGFRSVAQ